MTGTPPAGASAGAIEIAARFRAILEAAPDDRAAMRGLGLALAAQGADADALAWLDRAVADAGAPAQWHGDRGFALMRLRRPAEAADAFRAALARGPTPALHAALGDALMALRAHGPARDAYVAAVTAAPSFAAAWNNLAAACRELGALDAGIDACRKAIAAAPARVEPWLNLATLAMRADRPLDALAACDRALALRPGFATAERARGDALVRLGRLADALASYGRVLAAEPRHVGTLRSRAILLDRLDRRDEAIECMRQAVSLAPRDPDAQYDLGHLLRRAGRLEPAIAAFREAIRLKPHHGEAFSGLGAALWGTKRPVPALDAFRRAVALRPDNPDVQIHYGNALHAFGRQEESEAVFDALLARRPDHWPARLSGCIARLPIVYRDEAERVRSRAAYARDLTALSRIPLPADPAAAAVMADALRARQPFYLAYQGENDRDLQALHGGIACRVMAACHPELAEPPPRPGPAPGEPIRVGVLTAYFRHHSVWKVPLHSWLADLDRARFAVHGYAIDADGDAETERARALCRRFVVGPRSVAQWGRLIRGDRLHVLIVPEIGMDATTLQLAALRLAPVQATSWGHPQTSGMPTIDDFLSSALMEPPDGDHHYTERLVRLPGLSFRQIETPVAPEAVTRAEIGVADADFLFWCCQSLFKYLPRHDHVFARIAAALPEARFVFVGYPFGDRVEATVRGRLRAAFAAAGLSADHHCRFLGTISAARFAGVTGLADGFLDSIGWSGCNSTLEALARDVPVVTWPGNLMRGRHSAAILRMIGLEETIAGSEDGYVGLAVRLARDDAWRASLRARIAARKTMLREDRGYLAGLERYLVDAAAPAVLGSGA